MAGSQDPNENPVAINVVPMVDVIFCLCVFFMCCMKFKLMEGKFESWLPKDKGQSAPMDKMPVEIRVALLWNEGEQKIVRQLGRRTIADDTELQSLIRESKADFARTNELDVPVIIDAARQVPWHEVINVVNLAKREQVEKIEFAAGIDYNKGLPK